MFLLGNDAFLVGEQSLLIGDGLIRIQIITDQDPRSHALCDRGHPGSQVVGVFARPLFDSQNRTAEDIHRNPGRQPMPVPLDEGHISVQSLRSIASQSSFPIL